MENYYFIVAIIIFVVLIVSALFVSLRFSKKKKISESQKKSFLTQYSRIQTKLTSKEKIIDYDILYHKILQAFGYEGNFGEILKMAPNEIGDIDEIWKLHKLRNKLVHEFDLVTESVLKKKVKSYEKQIRILLK